MDNKINWDRPTVNYSNVTPEEANKIKQVISQASAIKWTGVFLIVITIILFAVFFILIFNNVFIAIALFVILYVANLIISIIVAMKIKKNDWIDKRLNNNRKSYFIMSIVTAIICLLIIGPSNWVGWAGMVKRTLTKRLEIIK